MGLQAKINRYGTVQVVLWMLQSAGALILGLSYWDVGVLAPVASIGQLAFIAFAVAGIDGALGNLTDQSLADRITEAAND